MSTGSTQVPDHARRIEDTLREASRHWGRSAVPRSERQDRLEELRLHLEEAAIEGRDVTEVIGPDVTAFAAQWIQADRPHPWLDTGMKLASALALSTAALALLGPVAFGLDGFAIRAESLALIGVIVVAALAVDIARRYRGHLSRRTVVLLGLAGVVAAGLLGGSLISGLQGRIVAELPVGVIVALLAIGATCAGISARLRRTSRTRRSA